MDALPRATAVGLLALAVPACSALHQPVPIGADATFAAHREHRGIVIDRLDRERSGTLRPPSWLRLPGAPTFVLVADGTTTAALWLAGSQVTVRRTPSPDAPVIGEVVPSWEDGAIRLALEPAGGPGYRTDVFVRQGAGGGPGRLTRIAETVIDVRGSYEATVRDAKGVGVGWFKLRISPYQPAPRILEGALPTTLPPELAAAAAAAVDAEIEWIEEHTLNVYRGNRGGPLEESIPVPH